jgi:hypothetical protein
VLGTDISFVSLKYGRVVVLLQTIEISDGRASTIKDALLHSLDDLNMRLSDV